MKNKYYINPDTDELIIATENADGEYSIIELSMIAELEYEDEVEEEEKPAEEKPKRQYKKREKAAGGGGVEESSGISDRRIGRKMKEKVRELLVKGFNSQRISDEIDEDLEFTNEIIERVKGEDMDFKVKEKEGVSI